MGATRLFNIAEVEEPGLFYPLSASVYKTFQTFKKMLQNMKEKCQHRKIAVETSLNASIILSQPIKCNQIWFPYICKHYS